MSVLRFIVLSAVVAFPVVAYAQLPDSLHFDLDESSVVSYRKTVPVTGDLGHSISFTPDAIKDFPKIMGEVDPVRVLQSMPGVATNSESNAGLYIHGFEDSHNIYTLAGAPAYLNPRVFGFLPILNETHYSRFRMRTDAPGCYLGGSLESEIADSLISKVHGDASVGLISARATVSAPLGKKAVLTASARQSFLNQVYKGMLRFESIGIRTSFTDVNLSLLWKPDAHNKFDAEVFCSYDDIGGEESSIFNLFVGGYWHQGVASLRWRHSGEIGVETVAYATGNFKNFRLGINVTDFKTPCNIFETGIRSKLELPLGFHCDLNLAYRDITSLDITRTDINTRDYFAQESLQADIGVTKTFNVGLVSIIPGVRFEGYGEFPLERGWFYADPELKVEVNMLKAGRLTLYGGRKHQFFSQMGISTSGVPMRFYVASGKYIDPQESYGASLSHTVDFNGGAYSLSTQAYWYRLFNQLEFRGFIFDFLYYDYDLSQSMMKTDGYNYGANIMLSKNTGKVTGWISYCYSRAMRTSAEPGLPDLFPASHDRPHELDAMVTWHIGDFDIGGNLVFASGNPYTRAKYFYFVGENIMGEYYGFNQGRLKNFFRMDLSASYNFKSHGRYSHGVNVSVFNVTAHRNEMVYYVKMADGKYHYHSGAFFIPVLPSVSYFCKF